MTTETFQKLVIKSRQEDISKVETFVEDILKLNNEAKEVELSYHISDNKKNIVFKIKDEGNGFDYNNLPDPTAPENIENLGGRGVFLMKQLADMVIFENNGAIVELSFRL